MIRPSAPVVIAVFRIRTDFNKSAFFTPVPVFTGFGSGYSLYWLVIE